MSFTACVECGKDVMYLDDLGCEPCICGYCKGWMCPTCEHHTACFPKIKKHNEKVRVREIDHEVKRLQAERTKLVGKAKP